MVDAARLRTLLDRLSEETAHLRRLATYAPAIETCIDVGEHIIASEGLRAPSSFAEIFSVLGGAGFVAPDSVQPLENMARFRNLLVHGYQRVDDQRVIEILLTRLDDFARFKAEIAESALD